jgi:uncharacterized protein YndB with AHSA1/START domain
MKFIKVESIINAPIRKVWDYWTNEAHITHWNFASSDWHCPTATNNLVVGSEFHYTMAAKDNSMSFDFWGTYKKVEFETLIEIVLGDGRQMSVTFGITDTGIRITEFFEPEQVNPVEMQQAGWQMILDNFKKYVEQ